MFEGPYWGPPPYGGYLSDPHYKKLAGVSHQGLYMDDSEKVPVR